MKSLHLKKIILVILICAVCTNVEALTRQFEYTGTVTSIYDPHGVVGEGYEVPLELYGTFTVDMTPIENMEIYNILSFVISFADISFELVPDIPGNLYWHTGIGYISGQGVGTPELPQGDWEWEWAEFGMDIYDVTPDDVSGFTTTYPWYFIVENYEEGAPDGFNFFGTIDTLKKVNACPNDPNKTEPGICGCGVPDTDTDLDGTPNCIDNCPNDPNKEQPGICGCGIADTDSDSDGIPDCNDNCNNLIDTDGDEVNDCDDLCPNDPDKIQPGTCGCGIDDIDSDGDGILDCIDSNDDGDGLPDGEEQGPDRNNPNYDGNGDGIADYLQDNVASFHTYNNQNYVTMESPAGTSMSNCKAEDNPAKSNAPSNVEFSFGFFGFSIENVDLGGASTVTLHSPAGKNFNTYYKYGPTPDNPVNHWYEFLFDGQTGAEMDGNIINLHFVDGLRGDDDLTANATISDIGAPGVIVDSGDSGDSGSQVVSNSGGGGGGCFISTTTDKIF